MGFRSGLHPGPRAGMMAAPVKVVEGDFAGVTRDEGLHHGADVV